MQDVSQTLKKLKTGIGVVSPVYRVEEYLPRCIESILSQSYRDFLLVLVDDGSPDRCGEICEDYAKKDHRVIVLHQKNKGLSGARNAGIDWLNEHCDTTYITFIDTDDWIHPQYLETLYRLIQTERAELSVCGFVRTTGEEPGLDMYSINPKVLTPEELWVKDRINATTAWGKLYKMSHFQELRYPEGKLHEDEFTTYQILFSCKFIAQTDLPLYFYYFNQDSIMNQKWNPKRMAAFEAKKVQMEFFTQNGYMEAYLCSLENYVTMLKHTLGLIQEYEEFLEYKEIIKNELIVYEHKLQQIRPKNSRGRLMSHSKKMLKYIKQKITAWSTPTQGI